ncbi:MAG: phosphatase PAP2 family protein [Bacteroidota bacterium]
MSLLISAEHLSLLQYFHKVDIGILRAIFENRNPALDSTFIGITDSAAALAFGIPGILLIIALLKKNTALRRNALHLLIPVALSAVLANILKYATNLPRPYEIYPFIEKLSVGGSPTFPSGHTADAFAFAIAAALVYPRWYVIVPVIIWACLVGYSRMCLGVHFPSDVLAGAFIGAAIASLYFWFEKQKHTAK